MEVINVEIPLIQTNGIINCRKSLDVEDLKLSIQALGLQTPVGISYRDGTPVLVYGFRRLEAMKQLGALYIDAKVLSDTDESRLYLLNLQENVTRQNLSPIEEAEAIQRLVALGEDPDVFAPALGWSKTLITQRLNLLELSDPVQEALHENTVSVRQAKAINDADQEHQEHLLLLAKDGATLNTLKQEIEQLSLASSVSVDDDLINPEDLPDEDQWDLDEANDSPEPTSVPNEDRRALAEANSNIIKTTLHDCGAKCIPDQHVYFAFQVAVNCVDFSRLPTDQLDALVSAINMLGGDKGLDVWGESAKR